MVDNGSLPQSTRASLFRAILLGWTNDVQYIVQCAAARDIDVMMEIDTHGHAAIIVTTYTEYVASFHASPWTNFANEPPAG
ncbi:uncharacterized protein HD556DRAFT_1439675 [Suillus plorans]|uniref:beta-N-acetylhexosaminidase n=1 Tax=Suillus plorans TaxID=116603 RepID=A0A9P7DNQ9_9AGAM|nr:uncharacterized protein HD556DRAFT_1439675 [Suillus plorans]KAG1799269.1 hypothetical protein HD556DRAFT_1439675 [Suillus plorans]